MTKIRLGPFLFYTAQLFPTYNNKYYMFGEKFANFNEFYNGYEHIHCNLVITLILGAKQNEHYNEMHLLNGIKRIAMDR